ncbi:hypothetical protein MKW92_026361 [Papaver armeniacum]|nr:hypothetical protein MKW92_026361 [Papaver armeniacum]
MPEHVYNLAEYISSSGDGYIIGKNIVWSFFRWCHAFHKSMGLNTLLLFNTRIGEVSRNLFLNLNLVRVLDLCNAGLSDLPDSIYNMTHLRFLDLSKNNINELPAELSMLHNLQTLIIDSNERVFQFPAGMEKLPNLRYLDLDSYQPFVSPPGIEQLTNLQTLRTCIAVGYYHDEVGEPSGITEEKETNYQDILINMKHLRKLELFWYPMKIKHADNLLASFKPHTNVKHLVLHSCCLINFLAWLGNPSFSNLEIIKVCGCYSCEFLPSLGKLPLLKYLQRFPSLKTLELESLSHLEKWTGLLDGDMPLLQELNIVGCQILTSLPTLKFPSSLQKLHIKFCDKLQAFPDEKPPSKLNSLVILYCPLLLERCKDEEHKDWGNMLKTAEEVKPLQ